MDQKMDLSIELNHESSSISSGSPALESSVDKNSTRSNSLTTPATSDGIDVDVKSEIDLDSDALSSSSQTRRSNSTETNPPRTNKRSLPVASRRSGRSAAPSPFDSRLRNAKVEQGDEGVKEPVAKKAKPANNDNDDDDDVKDIKPVVEKIKKGQFRQQRPIPYENNPAMGNLFDYLIIPPPIVSDPEPPKVADEIKDIKPFHRSHFPGSNCSTIMPSYLRKELNDRYTMVGDVNICSDPGECIFVTSGAGEYGYKASICAEYPTSMYIKDEARYKRDIKKQDPNQDINDSIWKSEWNYFFGRYRCIWARGPLDGEFLAATPAGQEKILKTLMAYIKIDKSAVASNLPSRKKAFTRYLSLSQSLSSTWEVESNIQIDDSNRNLTILNLIEYAAAIREASDLIREGLYDLQVARSSGFLTAVGFRNVLELSLTAAKESLKEVFYLIRNKHRFALYYWEYVGIVGEDRNELSELAVIRTAKRAVLLRKGAALAEKKRRKAAGLPTQEEVKEEENKEEEGENEEEEEEAEEEGEEEVQYEVEEIVAEKGKGKNRMYLVKWVNYALDEEGWEPRAALAKVDALDRWEARVL